MENNQPQTNTTLLPGPPRKGEPLWTDDPTVLWRDGNWLRVIPKSDMSRIEVINAIARLSVVGGGALALLFRSFTVIGLSMLLLLLSSQMAKRECEARTTTNASRGGAHIKRNSRNKHTEGTTNRRSNSRKGASSQQPQVPQQQTPALVYPQRKVPTNGEPKREGIVMQNPGQGEMSWSDFFGSSMSQGGGDAMGAYTAMIRGSSSDEVGSFGASAQEVSAQSASGQHQYEMTYEAPPQMRVPPQVSGPMEGGVDRNLVPISDVEEFQSGGMTLRTPFPRPATATFSPDQIRSDSTIIRNPDGTIVQGTGGAWAFSSPFETGYPTAYGPAPTAINPNVAQFVRPFAAEEATSMFGNGMQGHAEQASLRGSFQPSGGPVTFGAFMSDGGNTSSPITVPVPSGTVGSNFATDYYQPRHLAQAGAPLPTSNQCFPPDSNNPLGNPYLTNNRVARPKLCPPMDPRNDSKKFIDNLYSSTSSDAAGYQFMPFPVQDVIEARDAFQKWVIEDGQTHYKDKWSLGNAAGLQNIMDFNGGADLGF